MVIHKIIIIVLASEFHRNPSNDWKNKTQWSLHLLKKKKNGTVRLHETTLKSRLRDESSEFHGSWSGGLV